MRRGFSLLEVMLAGVIFIVAITAMTTALTAASTTGARALHQDVARDIARLRLEELLAAPATAPVLSIGDHTERRNTAGVVDAGGDYTVQWTVASHPELAVLRIALAVTWTEPNKTERIALETMR